MKLQAYYQRTVEPTVEPLSLVQLQDHILGFNPADAAHLERIIRSARQEFENDTGICLVEQTWQLTLPCFPEFITVLKPPLRQVVSIVYYDAADDEQTLDADLYRTTVHEERAIITPATDTCWPATRYRHDAVIITFKAGIFAVDGTAIDPDTGLALERKWELALEAIQILADHRYRNRGIVAPVQLIETPMSYKSLVTACRVEW